MAIFVFTSDACRRDAAEHNFRPALEKLVAQIESNQSLSFLDPFPAPYWVKKKFGGQQGRLIAEKRQEGPHSVVALLAVMIRGTHEYDNFHNDARGYGQQHLQGLVADTEIEEFIANRTKCATSPAPSPPSDSEYALLYGAFSSHQTSSGEGLVYETADWVEKIGRERIANQLPRLCQPCMDALGMDSGLHYVKAPEKQGWGVWAFRDHGSGRLLLLTPSTPEDAVEAERVARAATEGLSSSEEIVRQARRAYPALVLADEEFWIELEREREANMALSPEESEVLESVRNSERPFPLFINGRAGSGKSTILQYLFADILAGYIKDVSASEVNCPLYLTASSELLRRARDFTERLLRCESQHKLQGIFAPPQLLDNAFREFQPHLLSLVRDHASGKFPRATRINHAGFVQMWRGRFGQDPSARREYGPDISWHVIRTYIKGMSTEAYLDPDDYRELSSSQRTVIHETFDRIYESVWPWYRDTLESSGQWDDLDLTRFVLDNDLAKPLHPAVFCDEAQDFTRIELELLLRLNLFSKRALDEQQVWKVPFAFAGDQFQTLSPTGFRWSAIKASFVEKFIYALQPTARTGDLNFRELKFNYRSANSIVHFGNHIQLVRAALFGKDDVRPQEPWSREAQVFPVTWFASGNELFWQAVQKQSGFVILVPCEEGEEKEFVDSDPVLKRHVRIEDGIPVNVLSAARAKGCEYPAVLVYGFGEYCPFDLKAEIAARCSEGADPENAERRLPNQYFLNRLYVAVSRPKQRLVIVDSDQGFEKLWAWSRDGNLDDRMLDFLGKKKEEWREAIGGMLKGDIDALKNQSPVNPLEIARVHENDGIARRDGFLLRQAEQAYRAGGDLTKARECRARALEAEDSVYEAGDLFLEAGLSDDGIRCLWNAGNSGWKRLCQRASNDVNLRDDLRMKWARTMIGQPAALGSAEVLDEFAGRLAAEQGYAKECAGHPIWRQAIAALLDPLLAANVKKTAAFESWARIAAALERIRAVNVEVPLVTCAKIFYEAGQFGRCVELWDSSGEDASRDEAYNLAKARTAPYPELILPLAQIGLDKEVVRAYDNNRDSELESRQVAAVAEALARQNRGDDALHLAVQHKAWEQLFLIAAQAFQSNQKEFARRALLAGVALAVQAREWDLVSAAIGGGGDFVPSESWTRKERLRDLEALRRAFAEERDRVRAQFVRAFARTPGLMDAPEPARRRIQTFLREFLRLKDGKWIADIPIREAGIAFERAERFTESLGFYEAVMNSRERSAEDHHFAQERWLVCKFLQLDYESERNASGKVREIEREIETRAREWGIDPSAKSKGIPDLPEMQLLPKAKAAVVGGIAAGSAAHGVSPTRADAKAQPEAPSVPAMPVSVHVGQIEMKFLQKVGRCNLTAPDLRTAAFHIAEAKCSGELDFTRSEDGIWSSPSVRVRVRFSSPGELELQFPDEALTIRMGAGDALG